MTEQPAGAPACDICQEEPAVMSEMTLADYSTVYVGLRCLGPFYEEMASGFRVPPEDSTAEPAAPGPPLPDVITPEMAAGNGQPPAAGTAEAATGPRAARARTEGGTGRRKGS